MFDSSKGKQERPDNHLVDRVKERYCEVKTLGISDDETNRRASHKAWDGAVYFNLSTRFLNKLRAAVNRAWEQIHSVGETDLVFILVRFDDLVLDYIRGTESS